MRSFLFVLTLSATVVGSGLSAFADQYVNGYYRKDGTYVQPHYRSDRDGNPYNNYSYLGNTNPYTGERATGNSDTYLQRYNQRNTQNSDSYRSSNRPLFGR
jgi:hypothetical protein